MNLAPPRTPLPDGSQMKRIDRCAIDAFTIPGIVLMENAGVGTVRLMERRHGDLSDACIAIFVGPGNNGGDGLVIARHLHQLGARLLVVFLIDPDKLRGDSEVNLRIFQQLELDFLICDNDDNVAEASQRIEQFLLQAPRHRFMVDAIFGTGLDRAVEGHFKTLIKLINRLSLAAEIPVIGVDTPSGLDSRTGHVLGSCIRAATTAAYGCAKIGQLQGSAKRYTGELHIIDIGIPPAVFERIEIEASAITQKHAVAWLQRLQRPPDTHKGRTGHLMIAGGSAGKTGAPLLAARGALRSGCGLVTLFAPRQLNPIFETALAEAMTIPLEQSMSSFHNNDLDSITRNLEQADCLVVGPGLGQDPATAELVLALYRNLPIPLVIDADALNILAKHRDDLGRPGGARIFTPHPGEMARLLSTSSEEVQLDRVAAVRMCLDSFQTGREEHLVVLKGAGTVVAWNQNQYLNTTGNPGMATGGMGDVLSGLIGSLICQGLDLPISCTLGVFLHGFCADRLAERSGVGFTASEVADEIPAAVKYLEELR